jgi:chromosome partitioning protein
LIPFKPRSYDVWTIGDVKTIITEMKLANPNLKSFAFINQADTRGSDNDDTLSILKECEEFKCINVTIGNRKAFGNSSSDGLGVIEVRNADKKAIQEIKKLYDFVYSKCMD